MKQKTIYIIGNPIVSLDAHAISLMPFVQRTFLNYQFVHLDPTEEIDYRDKKEFIGIDTVMGIEKVMVFHTLDDFILSPRFSPHDYDLLTQLKLLQKLGKITTCIIIGIPTKGSKKIIQHDLKNVFSSMTLSENAKRNSYKGHTHG
ncbi:MAG TPA: hypothetical protein VJB63_03850 [Patescibacteria group bacterium]|nr:hypothetical protein [Patescibacteria group bacterium]